MPCPIALLQSPHLLEYSAWIAAVLALVQAVLLVIQTVEHRRYRGQRLRTPPQLHPSGRAAVFVPCKGLEPGLVDNLRPLFEQDYANYQLAFIVQSHDDPACGPIRALAAQYPSVSASLVIAGRANACGQKVHNLLRATERLSVDLQFLAFADSDVRTSPAWLRMMLQRLLTRADTGAVTGYRWLIPSRNSLANLVLYSLNSAIATLFTSGGHHLLWGGCWAIRRELFDALRIREAWQGVLSDDLAASRVIHRAGLRIKFEPGCMLAAPCDSGARDMLDFLYRQHFMLWRYAPRWSLAVLGATLIGVCGCWLPLAASWLAYQRAGHAPASLLALLALVYGLHVGRGVLRAVLAGGYFPEYRRALAPAAVFDTFCGPLAAIVSLSAILAAAFGRRVRWRQIRYRVDVRGAVLSTRDAQLRPKRSGHAAPLPAPAGA
ncbi:MAG TPA: glycosyltransferase [Pirellulales bacterium]|jgi:hypothetical protein|nr:glycosyltransferase [Pirellulales bacterium]